MGIGKQFIKETGVPYIEDSDQSKGVPCPPFEENPRDAISIIELPSPDSIIVKDIDLRAAIESRASMRRYSNSPLTLEELSYLLWCTQGVRKVTENATYRNVPSAGSRHALETYLLINNVEGLDGGLYKYKAIGHSLMGLQCYDDIIEKVKEACPKAPFISNSAVTFIWTSVFYRMEWRHGERGYRYVHLDAGHVCENLYLAAQSIDSGVCAISVFIDQAINNLLKIDGEKESVIYLAALGKV